jgi:NTE family protein
MPGGTKQKIALVLCGGGSRGAVEIGFYRALIEIGVPIDFIVGSSIGALNGAFIAAGVSVDQMYELWRNVRFRDVFGLNWRLLISARKAESVYGDKKLRRFLERHLPARQFEDLPMPLTILATDLETGESARLERGDLIEAVLASVAIPGLLPPVRIQGRRLFDGDIANNLPLDVAVDKGATAILAIRCRWDHCKCALHSKEPTRGIVNILSRSFDIAETARCRQEIEFHSRQAQTITLEPRFHFFVGLLDFSRGAELLDEACCFAMSEQARFRRVIESNQAAEEAGAVELTVDLRLPRPGELAADAASDRDPFD